MMDIAFESTDNIRFVSAGKYIAEGNPAHPKRRLSSAVLLIGSSGECPMQQDGRPYSLVGGTYMLLFPGHEHGGTAPVSDGQSHFWCHFSFPDAAYSEHSHTSAAVGSVSVTLPEFGKLVHPEKFFTLFHQMIDAAERPYLGGSSREQICGMYIRIILRELYENALEEKQGAAGGGNSHTRAAARAKEYLRLHFADKISMTKLSELFHYSSDYLNHIFKREFGITLCAYLSAVRLNNAKRLLLDTDLSVACVAEAVGFSDPKHFMKAFKRFTGVTPSEFRGAYFRVHENLK